MSETLKPCPWCGNESNATVIGNDCFYRICEHCDCEGPKAKTEADAFTAWNTRKETQQ
jgi:Lar family restriction alleviation protein